MKSATDEVATHLRNSAMCKIKSRAHLFPLLYINFYA